MCEDVFIYLFGYGSLIWRPGFPYLRRFDGFVKGWKRVFWQGSTDHRGVPGAPGRVVTLIKEPPNASLGWVTWGAIYCIPEDDAEVVLRNLDYREKGGYIREEVDIYVRGQEDAPVVRGALMYLATQDNREFLGDAPSHDIARQVYSSVGPSGPNMDYVLNLAAALRRMAVEDDHVFEIEAHVRDLIQAASFDPPLTATATATATAAAATTAATAAACDDSAPDDGASNETVERMNALQRKYFLAQQVVLKGSLQVDAGAVMAVSQRGRSLLPAGVVRVTGSFAVNDLVSIIDQNGREVARGVAAYSADEALRVIGHHSSEISVRLGFTRGEALVHHNNMILV